MRSGPPPRLAQPEEGGRQDGRAPLSQTYPTGVSLRTVQCLRPRGPGQCPCRSVAQQCWLRHPQTPVSGRLSVVSLKGRSGINTSLFQVLPFVWASDCTCQPFKWRLKWWPGKADFRSATEWVSPSAVEYRCLCPISACRLILRICTYHPYYGCPALARERQLHPTQADHPLRQINHLFSANRRRTGSGLGTDHILGVVFAN